VADRITPWLREKIAEASPEAPPSPSKLQNLLGAAASLRAGRGMMFGMMYSGPPLPEGDALLAETLAMIERWLPRLDAAELAEIERTATTLGLDISPFLEDRKAAKAAELAAKRATLAGGDLRNPELERAIVERPDDVAAFSVYADWLEANGSPRGELIQLALRAEAEPSLGAQVDAFLTANADALLGELPDYAAYDDSTLIWRRGFIYKAKLSSDSSVAKLLEQILIHPSGRFLAELAIGMNGDSGDVGLDDVLDVLSWAAPAALRSLFLGDFMYPDDCEMSWYLHGDTVPPWRALANLRTLIVQGGSFALGDIELPLVEHAEFRTGGLSTESAQSIAAARWPKLERLDVWFGMDDYGGNASLDDVRALLARRDLPNLRHLALANSPEADTLVELLVSSPLLARLEVLDLSKGTLGNEGALVMLAQRERFAHLRRIDVSRSYLGDTTLESLRGLGPEIIADDLQGFADRDDRYVTVSE
jgi:uncharacterized protein (TIGR02996 family)